MQPFDLEKALAGAKLITRHGHETTRFSQETNQGDGYDYNALFAGSIYYYNASGKWVGSPYADHSFDLFIDEEESAPHLPNILQQANELIYGERHVDYGSVTDNFSDIAVMWSVISGSDISAHKALLMMAALKICREKNKPKRDNLVDLAGYAGCLDKLSRGE